MIDPINKSARKNSIQIKVGFLMAAAVILLAATCWMSYKNLSSIVSRIQIEANPDISLLNIRDISMDLEKAENSFRIFTITGDPEDIRPYYNIIAGIDDKINILRSECKDDSVLLKQADNISDLIEKNVAIWNALLLLNKDDKVISSLRQLSDQLDSVAANTPRQGILKRVFERDEEILPEEGIVDDLNDIVRQDSISRQKMRMRESMLARNSNQIKENLYDLITQMENEVTAHSKARALEASQIADKTYPWLVMFLISGGLMSLLVLFIIFRYISTAYAYQSALENSKNEVEKLARTKEMFMANMSHEIRTPVTAISGFTDQLLHESFDENATRSLKIIKSSSDHLLKIIDDILDFSKLQNNKLSLEKVNFSIHQIVEDVYNLFEKQALQYNTHLGYSLSPDTPSVLLGDPYRLKQIMINLVSNSIKFTKNGSVHFTVSDIIKQADEIELVMEFKDTGIGIDESKINIIFEDFTQAEMSTTRKYGGTGLGLSIVKKLVDLHNGTIDIKSRKNQGTVITCRLPYLIGDEKQVKKEVVQTSSVPEEISGLKILIVDDEEYNRLLFKKILDRWKIRYQEAENGMDALELLKEVRFDLLFMDIRMPGIDGIKATSFIREEMKISEADMPIVFISAAPINEEWQKYRTAGMNAYLQKPFTEEMLLTTIMAVLENNTQFTLSYTNGSESIKPLSSNKINLDNLYHISGNDEKFVKHMLVSFNNTTKQGLEEMQQAVSLKQWESVANLAHKLLAPCRHIGANELYDLLGKIENNSRNNFNIEFVESLIRRSLREFDTVSELINEHIAKMN